jgi:superfamily II DNA helicase RecQ
VLLVSPQQVSWLDALLDRLPSGALVTAVGWQGAGGTPEQLFAWRRELLRRRSDYVAAGPCGQEYGRELPTACESCRHGRRAELHCAGGRVTETPAWSYVLLIKSHSPVEQPRSPCVSDDVLSMLEVDDLHARYLGTFHEKQYVAAHPDEFNDNPAETQWHIYLRLCPGHTDLSRLAIEGNAGMPLPRLGYGQWLHLQGARPSKPYSDQSIGILHLRNEASVQRIPSLPVEDTFLPAYGPTVRAAVDETAFRLFGFEALWPFQHTVLERVLCGRDIFAIAATGGGKSECYVLPAMLLPGITVVVSPLKSLMQDQYEQRIRDRYGLDHLTTFINGDVKFYERQGRLRRAVLGHFRLLYVTPEQLERGYVLDALRQAAQTVGVRYLALDEAHCISQWGHDFRPSYLNIVERLRDYGLHPRRIALTATASPLVRDDVCQELYLDKRALHEGGDVLIDSANRPELNLVVQRVPSTEDKARIIVDALRRQQDGSAIVFMPHTGGKLDKPDSFGPPRSAPDPANAGMVSTGVSAFARYLKKQLGQPVAQYHGAMDDQLEGDRAVSTDEGDGEDVKAATRQEEQRRFMANERRVMVATKGFGMGIDKPDIRLVIHRSPPANLEAYAQEAGRAGRDGMLATVMLLFSEDKPWITPPTPDTFLRRNTLPSDREIQDYFIHDRYVRRQDIEAMVAFLRSDRPKHVNGALYFTNDMVMEAFDICEDEPEHLGLSGPYQWPKFKPRLVRSRESPEHKQIRDRGHSYAEKRTHIGRILKVLYNTRPTLGGKVVPLIHAAHETGIVLRRSTLRAPERIVESLAYFGERLRRAGVDARELRALLPDGDHVDVTPLAVRLGLSLRETVCMLSDIRYCEVRTDRYGRWVGTLLDYWWVEAPRWVGLPDPYNVDAWREYAGAYTREKGGTLKRLEDYFPERTLNKPWGWEVTPGEGLNYPDPRAFMDAFVALHDARREGDERNFAYLIERYIGAGTDAQGCLRSLLLGYLKTGETVLGGNCLGCSVCVPDLDFERYTVAQRRNVIVRLAVETLDLLDAVEQCNRKPLPVEVGQQLLAAIAREDAQGRAGSAYLESWLARLIQDDPEHQGALWLRLRAFEQGVLQVPPEDVMAAIGRLTSVTQAASPTDELRRLVLHWLQAPEFGGHKATLIRYAAQLAGSRGAWREETELWEQAREFTARGSEDDKSILIHLLRLYDRTDRVNDPARAAGVALHLVASPVATLAEARTAYTVLSRQWAWADVEAELDAKHPHSEAALLAWLETGEASARREAVEWVASHPEALTQWPTAAVREIAERLETDLSGVPNGALALAEVLASTRKSATLASKLLLRAWAGGGSLSPKHIQALAANLDELDPAECRQVLARRPGAGELLTALRRLDENRPFPLGWLAYFPEGVVGELPDDIFGQVWEASLGSGMPPGEELLKQLLTRVNASSDAATPLLAALVADQPDIALRVIEDVLEHADDARPPVVKTLFPALLSPRVDARRAANLLGILSGRRAYYQDDDRMAVCLDIWEALEQDRATWPLLRQKQINSSTLVEIAKKWLDYKQHLHRLDMLVVILGHVCISSNPNWLTPVALQVQALCAAGRFREAEAIIATEGDLRIRGLDATVYLKQAWKKRQSRGPAYESDFQRLWALAVHL